MPLMKFTFDLNYQTTPVTDLQLLIDHNGTVTYYPLNGGANTITFTGSPADQIVFLKSGSFTQYYTLDNIVLTEITIINAPYCAGFWFSI